MTKSNELYAVLEDFFVRCLNMGEAESMDRLVELDLSLTQAKTLFVLAQAAKPMPIHALAERIRLSMAAMGRNVDHLVHAGLVERREDLSDRRVKLVSITKDGREAANQHIDAKRAALRAFVGRLDSEQAKSLHDSLKPILAGDALRPTSEETSA